MSSAREGFPRKPAPNKADPESSPTRGGSSGASGPVDDAAVVGPDRVGLEVALVADLGGEREAPSGVDATAVGREDAEAPVADLVAEALDDDRLVGGDDAGRLLLLAQVA